MKATSKSYLLVAALLLLVAGIFPSPRCKAQTYREYYELIGEAFDHIVNADYRTAMYVYKKAFAKFSKHPAGVGHAIDCALYLGDTAFAMQCLREKICRGSTLERIKKEHAHLYFSESIVEQMEREYPALRASYIAKVDSAYYHLLREMEKEDQVYARAKMQCDASDTSSYLKLQYLLDSIVLKNSKQLHGLLVAGAYPKVPMFGQNTFPLILMVHHFQTLGQIERKICPIGYAEDVRVQQLYNELKTYDMRPLMIQWVHEGDIAATTVRNLFELGDGAVLSADFTTPITVDLQNRNIIYNQPTSRLLSVERSLLLLDSQKREFDQQISVHSYLSPEQFPFEEAIAFCVQHEIYGGEKMSDEKIRKWGEFKQQLAERLNGDPRVRVFKIEAPFYQVKFPLRKP